MSPWPPAAVSPEATPHNPWRPASLGAVFDDSFAEDHAYVVVDEMVDNGIGLSVAPWPEVDEGGRLRFAPEEDQQLLGADRDAFEAALLDHRTVVVMRFGGELDASEASQLRKRPLRIGDVFVIRRDALATGDDEGVVDSERLIKAPIYDITVEARERARVAMAATQATPIEEGQAREVLGADALAEPVAADEASEPVAATPQDVVSVEKLADRNREQ